MKKINYLAIFMACAACAALNSCGEKEDPTPEPVKGEVVAGEALEAEGVEVKDGPIYYFDVNGGAVELSVSTTNTEGYEDHLTFAVETNQAWCTATINEGVLVIKAEPNGDISERSAVVIVSASLCDPESEITSLQLNIGQEAFDAPVDMALVKAGTFTFGAGVCCSNSNYTFDVKLTKDFYMSKTEITQKVYAEVMGDKVPDYKGKFVGNNYPAHTIKWTDACEFCNVLSQKEGLTPVYTVETIKIAPDSWSPEVEMQNYVMNAEANGYRLPTSAEWEYAAKGGEEGAKTPFVYAGSNDYLEVAWMNENSEVGDATALHEVAQKLPNQLGIYDLSGNIEEWCYDWDAPYYGYTYPTELTEDFAGPTFDKSNKKKVMRGGAYSSGKINLKLYYLRSQSPIEEDYYQARGFRIVRNAK